MDVSPGIELDIAAEGAQEIVQNVAMILSTPKGSIPLDRDFGTDWHFLDLSMPRSMARARSDIVRTLRRYEPRAIVRDIRFAGDGGRLRPRVRIDVE